MRKELPTSPEQLLQRLRLLHERVRDAIVARHRKTSVEVMSRVAHEDRGDTVYAIDVDADRILTEFCREWATEMPFVLVAEGINPDGEQVFPENSNPTHAQCRIIVDPIDGTRGLMYDKRSAWILSGIAPDCGPATSLADIEVAVQTEIPPTKQDYSDALWAIRGRGAAGERTDLRTGRKQPLRILPSQAETLEHGFATVSNFFPGGKALTSEIEEELFRRAIGEVQPGKAVVYSDHYISSGGQLYELMSGHDRFICDIRSIVNAHRGADIGLCVRPYDVCTELIAREAGCVILAPDGAPLDAPLDTKTNLSWVGYANRRLADRVHPLFQEILRERGLIQTRL